MNAALLLTYNETSLNPMPLSWDKWHWSENNNT